MEFIWVLIPVHIRENRQQNSVAQSRNHSTMTAQRENIELSKKIAIKETQQLLICRATVSALIFLTDYLLLTDKKDLISNLGK